MNTKKQKKYTFIMSDSCLNKVCECFFPVEKVINNKNVPVKTTAYI